MNKIVENITTLRNMIEAYPEALFDLESFTDTRPCGTLYCSVGLAASQPFFIKQGLSLDENGGLLVHGKSVWSENGQEDLDGIFGPNSFDQLFSTRNDGYWDSDHPEAEEEVDSWGDTEICIDSSVTDKQLALWRIDQVLNKMGVV